MIDDYPISETSGLAYHGNYNREGPILIRPRFFEKGDFSKRTGIVYFTNPVLKIQAVSNPYSQF
jgi:hypothetical protein